MKLIKELYQKYEVHIKMFVFLMLCMTFINWDCNPAHWNGLCRTLVVVLTMVATYFIQALAYLVTRQEERNAAIAKRGGEFPGNVKRERV